MFDNITLNILLVLSIRFFLFDFYLFQKIIYKLRQFDNYFITHFLECPFCQGFWTGFIYSLILLPFTFIQSFSFGFITGFISYVYYFSTYLLFTKAEEEKCEWLKTQKPKNKS